ncbi:hypothetical protein JHK82_024871 [Glycine max]|nr:hypothetical protein JHK85_025479 [Glycine max]KAG5133683.1 hypothetical protein JHK82_024871 [Glycine max]
MFRNPTNILHFHSPVYRGYPHVLLEEPDLTCAILGTNSDHNGLTSLDDLWSADRNPSVLSTLIQWLGRPNLGFRQRGLTIFLIVNYAMPLRPSLQPMHEDHFGNNIKILHITHEQQQTNTFIQYKAMNQPKMCEK